MTRTTLDNGVRLVLMEYHRAPTITVIAQFPGGTATDPRDKAGVADLTADLIRKGTSTRSAEQIAEQIDFLGGSLEAGAGLDRFTVTLDVMSKDTDTGLDLFSDVIRNATFPADEIDRSRQLSIAGLEALPEDPGAIARRVANQTVYAGHPYGLQPTIASLKAIARDDLIACYRHVVAPNRMMVIAVGDFNTTALIGKLKTRFGDWPKSESAPAAVPPVPPSTRRQVMIDKPDATQTQVRWVRTAFPRSSPDYFPAQIADSILGGGFTSRLIDEVRVNRSLTYSIGSGFSASLHGGTFGVTSFTKIETTRALIDATDSVLRRAARKGFTPAEIQKVKGYMAGTFATSMETPEALAGELAEIAFYNLPHDYLQAYLSRLRAVTLSQADRIANTYFGPENLSLVLVAPAKRVDSQLKGLGAFETRPVETAGK